MSTSAYWRWGEIHRDCVWLSSGGLRGTSVRTIVGAIDLRFVTSELIEAEKTQAREIIQSNNGYWCRVARQYPIVRDRS